MASKILLAPLITTLWKCIGYNLYKTTVLMNFTLLVAFFLIISVPMLGLSLLVFDEVSIPNIASAFESTGPYSQVFVKIVLNRLSLNIIRELLNEIETKFWKIDHFGEEVKEEQMKTYLLVKNSLKFYIYILYPCCILMTIKPLLYEHRIYPLQVYNIVDVNNTKYYVCYYFIQVFGLFYVSANFLAVDGLFVLFIVNVLSQIIMLTHAFSTLNLEKVDSEEMFQDKYKKLIEYVDHHNLILKFIQKLSDLYSVQMFFQFIGNTASICVGTFIMSSAGMDDISTTIRAFSIVLCWFFQLAVYCFAGNLITVACEKVAFSMYESNWEGKYNAKFRFATQMIIMQSQKPTLLRAGKFFEVNVTSFSGVLRLAVSIYTLMNKVQSKKE